MKRQRQSRPISSTETAKNQGKTAVSSHLRHRDRTKPRKNSSLVPSQAPRQHKTPEKQQSRPFPSTETTQNTGKTTVSSLLKHLDYTKPRKNSSLVPSPTPRPHKTTEKQQSRPVSGTDTAQNHGKTAVSSLLKHLDHTLRKAGRRENSTAVGRSAGFAHGRRKNAAKTKAVPQRRPLRQAHGKRDAHQTRNAFETAATVSSLLKHRYHTLRKVGRDGGRG